MVKLVLWMLGLLTLGYVEYKAIIHLGYSTHSMNMVIGYLQGWSLVSFYTWVALSEESVKLAGGCLLFMLGYKRRLVGLDLAAYLSALAFAIAEAVSYVWFNPDIGVILWRILCAIPVHLAFGLYVGRATRKWILATAIAFCVAVAIHAAYNIACTLDYKVLAMWFVGLCWYFIITFFDYEI